MKDVSESGRLDGWGEMNGSGEGGEMRLGHGRAVESCRCSGGLLEKSGRGFWPGMLSFEFPEGGNGGRCRDGELSKEDGGGGGALGEYQETE